jgi:hypothetical protein
VFGSSLQPRLSLFLNAHTLAQAQSFGHLPPSLPSARLLTPASRWSKRPAPISRQSVPTHQFASTRPQTSWTIVCACTGMYVHSTGSIQMNSISPTAYIERSAIEYIHKPHTFNAVQMSAFFTAQLSTFHGFHRTNNMDLLTSTIPYQIMPFKQSSHRDLTLPKTASL